MLVVKEQTGTFPSELAQLKSDIELFRRAVCDYEFKRYQEAEDTMAVSYTHLAPCPYIHLDGSETDCNESATFPLHQPASPE